MSTGFIVPVARMTSGGHRYNDAILAHWPGTPPAVMALDGPWPNGDAAAREALAAALTRHPVTLVDGLVGAAHPDLLVGAAAAGRRVALLVHLPLADEGGLDDDERARLEALERASVHAAWRVVATSRTAAAGLALRHRCGGIRAATPGVESAPLAEPHEPPHLVMVGSISPRKDQVTVARALASLTDLRWTATIAGPVVHERHAAAARAVAPRRRVRFVGDLDAAAMADLWAGADLLLHPAHAETWGMVVTEALARGIPAIVGAGTGAVEALTSGTPGGAAPGATVEPGDPAALASLVRRWLTDRTLRDHWRERAHAARSGLKDWNATAAEIAALLEES